MVRILKHLIPDTLYIILSNFYNTGKIPNLLNPKTLNEKIVWLKINDRRSWHHLYADKILSKNIVSLAVGEKFVVPTLFTFKNVKEAKLILSKKDLTYPVIIKPNHDSGGGYIINSASDLNDLLWKKLHDRLSKNYYFSTREWQYKNIVKKILVEPLLLCKNKKIPNDFKFHMLNGKLAFVYCSIDREGLNYRKIYNNNWENEGMFWGYNRDIPSKFIGPEIPRPIMFDKMIELSEKLSKGFSYIRIDFYVKDDEIFVGELTQHQYGGNALIKPIHFDFKYGQLLKLCKSSLNKPY